MKQTMKSMIKKLQLYKLRNRFMIVMILLSIPPIFLVGYISYHISSNSVVENYNNYYYEQLTTFNERVDYVFKSIIKMNRYILSNSELQRLLTNIGLDENEQTAAYQLQTIISDYIVEREYIDSVCLIDNTFRAICNGRSDNLGIYEGDNKEVEIQQSEWYEKAVAQNGREYFFTYNVLVPSDDTTISTVKWLRNPRDVNFEAMGFLIININKSLFQNSTNVAGNEGLIVTNQTEEEIEKVYTSSVEIEELMQDNSTIHTMYSKLEDNDYIYNQYRNRTTGWNFLHVVKEDTLLDELHNIRDFTFVVASVISVFAIILSIILSKTITNPLEKLKVMMIRWSKGEFGFKEKFNNDEVGQIGETFKEMAMDNKELMENIRKLEVKEREAELRVLQAHINPHFLYNTLDSIYWMAMINNQHNIGKMSVALSDSFKIILSKGKTEIPIRDEIKHIDHYMTIQNIRYNNRFTYHKEIDPAIMDILVLKLLFQPLVENAIYHGLEKKVGPGRITIRGKQYKQMIEFYIADDGIGLDNNDLIYQGYGLKNIQERLRLYYGPSSSFKIKSIKGKGTVVRIRFNPTVKGVYEK